MLTAAYITSFLGMILLPIILWIYFTRKLALSWKLLLAGGLTFVASQVLHIPLVIAMGSFLQSVSLLVNAIILGLLAGVFEETARYILFRRVLKNIKSWKEGILVGLGHGGTEALLLGILAAVGFANMMIYQNIDLSTVPSIPADQLELAKQQVAAYWSAPWYIALMGFVERIFAIPGEDEAFDTRQGRPGVGEPLAVRPREKGGIVAQSDAAGRPHRAGLRDRDRTDDTLARYKQDGGGVAADLPAGLQLSNRLVDLPNRDHVAIDVCVDHVERDGDDAVLRVTDERGTQLAWNHDERTLDPALVFTAPQAGRYVIQVFGFPYPATSEIRFHGGEKCVYQLRLHAGPYLSHTLPLGAGRSGRTGLQLAGWNLPAGFPARRATTLTGCSPASAARAVRRR